MLNLLPAFISFVGAYLLIKLRFFFILKPKKTFLRIKECLKDKKSRNSFFLALAGTLGVGNVVGVSYALSVGGAGSLFWLLVSALFSSVIKYAESLLAADVKEEGDGGMMYVIKKSFVRLGVPVSILYAAFCLLLTFVMGGALQSKSAVVAASGDNFRLCAAVSLLFALIIFISVVKGVKRIEKITSCLIPLCTVVYVFMCLSVVIVNFHKFPEVITKIMAEAFNIKSGASGILLFLFSKSVREGFSTGLLSNEAGAGSSAMAEARAEGQKCTDVGLLGMLEVVFDTVLLCMLSGLAILFSGVGFEGVSESSLSIVTDAFATVFGRLSSYVLPLLIMA